jgi:hypothetical protein
MHLSKALPSLKGITHYVEMAQALPKVVEHG